MKKPISIAAALVAAVAGFFGGAVSQRLLSAPSVHAEILPAREVRATNFTLVDRAGKVYGEFKVKDGKPEITLFDEDGRVAWRATTNHGLQPLAANSAY